MGKDNVASFRMAPGLKQFAGRQESGACKIHEDENKK